MSDFTQYQCPCGGEPNHAICKPKPAPVRREITAVTPNMTAPFCQDCGGPIRWSTSYDEPHWVHVRAQDTLTCPVYSRAGAR